MLLQAYYAQLAYNKQDNSQQTGVFLGRLENPDLKWETTKEFNVGLILLCSMDVLAVRSNF